MTYCLRYFILEYGNLSNSVASQNFIFPKMMFIVILHIGLTAPERKAYA